MSTDSEASFGLSASIFDSGESDSKSETSGSEIENVSDAQRWKLESLGGVVSSANENLKLSESDLVWGKVSSYPWWPGQVFPDASSVASKKAMKYFKKGAYLVAYFGDCSFAWNDVSKIKPFHQHFSQMVKQSDSPEFRNAVGCALEEVSRRVEFGLSCACVSEEAYERFKSQNVMNPGIREESRVRYGGDKVSSAVFFEPGKLVEHMKSLASCPRYDESDKLLFVNNRAQVLAFQKWTSYLSFPRYKTFLRSVESAKPLASLPESNTDEEVSTKRRKQDTKDIAEKTLSDCIGEEHFGRSKSVKKMVGKRKVEPLESGKPMKNKRQKEDSSVGNKLQKVVGEPCFVMRAIPLRMESEMAHTRKLNLEHSNYEDFEKFIEETSCSNLNHDSEKVTEISEASDVKESSDQQNLPENKDIPNALVLKFASSDSVPSVEKLNSIFNRYGPLREAETRVMRKSKKARVVFKRVEDAKTAFSSSGKYGIFGASLLSYSLKYVGLKAKERNELTH